MHLFKELPFVTVSSYSLMNLHFLLRVFKPFSYALNHFGFLKRKKKAPCHHLNLSLSKTNMYKYKMGNVTLRKPSSNPIKLKLLRTSNTLMLIKSKKMNQED